MSQTKQECMEFMIVLLDEMKAQVKKIMHKDNYQTYDDEVPDTEDLHVTLSRIDAELETLDYMFEASIPKDVRAISMLEAENESLRQTIKELRGKIRDQHAPPSCLSLSEINQAKERLNEKTTG